MSHPGDRYAACEVALRLGAFRADVAGAREAGVRALGVDADAVDAVGVDEARAILDGEGVGVSSYMGLGTILADDGKVVAIDDVCRRLDVAAALGAPVAVVASGRLGSHAASPAESMCHEWLGVVGALADERGVRVGFEPVHPVMRRWSFVHTLHDGLRLVAGLTGVGVLLDLGHVWWEAGLVEQIREHASAIVAVQVTNVDSTALDEVRYERAPVHGGGDVPVGALVAVLESAGYRGWYEDETVARIPRDQRVDGLRASREWFEAL